jgi:hypothetical protein
MICSQCGEEHSIDDMELTFRRPDVIAEMDAGERERTVQEDDDLCAIKSGQYFVRALLPLPVESRSRDYAIGLWVQVEESTFRRVIELWSEPNQVSEPPFSAWLANTIPTVPNTLGLAVQLHLTGPTTRPRLKIASQGHPLAVEQHQGITAHRANEYSSLFA